MISNQISYTNHRNEVLQFGQNGLYILDNELHNYAWNYTLDKIIGSFNRGIVTKKITIAIASKDRNEAIQTINKIVEITDKDILANEYGTLRWNDYYLKCYITKSEKTSFENRNGLITAELELVTDKPAWTRETETTYMKGSGSGTGKNLDFPFDFPYDFASPSTVKSLKNTAFSDSDFKLIIFGQVSNPEIYINGHLYSVNGYIAQGEYLTIDSKNKTVILTQNDGTEVNWFKNRNKDSYIFQKIPTGELPVSWDSINFGFNITLYEERSEPRWT